MHVYSRTVPDLEASGPALQVSVGASRELIAALGPLGQTPPLPVSVSALVDTGAHTSVLNPDVVSRLGIRAVGTERISTPSTTTPIVCSRFHINLYFADDHVIENIFVIEAPMGGVPYQCLIGRDVLRLGSLLYEGHANAYTLTFP